MPHSATTRDLHGLIRIAGLSVAIRSDAIREVVPCPEALEPFPRLRTDIAGALDLRGQLIPVLDLSEALGATRTDDKAQIVLILRHGDHVIGVLAEAIDGVCALPADAQSPLFATSDSDGRLLRASFHLPAGRGVVLDVAALAALPDLPLTEDRTGARDRAVGESDPTLMFRVGNLRCALAAACVDASVPWQELLPAPSQDPLWIAMLPYKGAEIPVVDTLALLDQGGTGEARRAGAAIVVRVEGAAGADGKPGLVALLIDSVDDIVRLPARDVRSHGLPGMTGAGLTRGLITRPEGSLLLIDAQALVNDARMAMLAGIRQRPQTGSASAASAQAATRATAAGERLPYLVFMVDEAPFAVALSQVEEILPAQHDLIPTPAAGSGVEGLFPHRGQAVPLVNLGRMLGRASSGEGSFVVVAREGQWPDVRRTGFRVDRLCSVDRAAIQQLGPRPGEGAERQTSARGLPDRTIRLVSGEACTVLDLPQIARGLVEAAA
ncbi:chemotaxis protein CheW [Novosphingobium cyanobacteriorum]|uniref:Chemotaxis protein CheW n=1 Tax=Novosphingobium cyanobacteriorum TaxID=3024215 RepID=A0ABT6CMA9_9SPHN|nr:chemotaxis protein CheW [Novosphingobium cyanobacteriorum]MDF8333467.1 chemotaxis protein CheW [Novosphingobium cyanobacteriorum]